MTNTNADALALADRFWDQFLEIEPLIGTEVGDERFDDRLADPSEEGLAHQKSVFESALQEAKGLDRSSLDQVARTTLDVLEAIARRSLLGIEHRTDRFYAVNHLFGPAGLLADLGTLQQADTPERLQRYLARLKAVPTYLEELGKVAEGGAKVGQSAPRLVIDRTIAQIERLLASDPAASPAVKPVPESDAGGRQQVTDVLGDAVWPGYQAYLDMLRRYRPMARETIGLSALDGGDATYAALIVSWTTLAMDPKVIHEIGQSQMDMIQQERREIAANLGYQDIHTALAEYQASGKNTAATRKDMLRVVEDQVQRGWDAAPKYFGRLPRANCNVLPVEEFREADMPGAFYVPPNSDGTRTGVYYVNTYKLEERPLHHTASTSYHEANPGHHFQISLEQEHADRPPLRRFGSAFVGAAFTEGWGLYSERLADEMGLFLNEYERLGMLEAQALRAGRLIVDTGIHALGWDRERSIAQMEKTGAPRVDAEIEVDRYIAMPGQALAYMIGQLQIQRWRKEAEERGGAAFSLSDFHDRLLAIGSLPLESIKRELNGAPPTG